MKRIIIELDEASGELKFSLPDNIALALGLLDMTRELVLAQHVRNVQRGPQVLGASAMPPLPPTQ
jgi:hypothetical protein